MKYRKKPVVIEAIRVKDALHSAQGVSQMSLYMIRRRSDGAFFHALPRQGARATADEPSLTGVPRLWDELRYARQFLTVWCQGIQQLNNHPDYYGEIDGGIRVTPVKGRNKDDFEIIEVTVEPVQGTLL